MGSLESSGIPNTELIILNAAGLFSKITSIKITSAQNVKLKMQSEFIGCNGSCFMKNQSSYQII
jgi:hypothetical protein